MDYAHEYRPTIVFGCGNPLLGDDGFGPKVVDYLENNYAIPPEADVVDAGTGLRTLLFDLVLSPRKPERVIIVDAVNKGRSPGEVFEVSLQQMVDEETAALSLHLAPSSSLLAELKYLCGVDVIVLGCQPARIPEEVSPGLSEELERRVPEVSHLIFEKYLE